MSKCPLKEAASDHAISAPSVAPAVTGPNAYYGGCSWFLCHTRCGSRYACLLLRHNANS